MPRITVTVEGTRYTDEVEPRMLLVQYLRERLGKTGTVVGCDTSNCGACTVHLGGQSVKSCSVLAVQADGQEVTTIEGLARDGQLHPIQQAFHENHALQCGFCTPGMIMQALDLLSGRAGLNRHQGLAEHLGGVLADFVDRMSQPDAPLRAFAQFLELALAAAAGVDLRLHDPQGPGELLSGRDRFVDAHRRMARRNGNTGCEQQPLAHSSRSARQEQASPEPNSGSGPDTGWWCRPGRYTWMLTAGSVPVLRTWCT